MRRVLLTCACALAFAGCADDEERGRVAPARTVTVPELDDTPPAALLVVDPAGPAGPVRARRGEPGRVVALDPGRPGLRVTATGRDPDGGVARTRISIEERIECVERGGRRRAGRLRIRYFPPPQIARAKVAPGTPLPVARSRTRRLRFGDRACAGAPATEGLALAAVDGRVWADITNGHERESSSAPVRYRLRLR